MMNMYEQETSDRGAERLAELMRSRRSIRRFRPELPERRVVDRIAQHVEPAHEQTFRAYGDYFTRFVEAPLVIVCLYRNFPFLSNLVDQDLASIDREQIDRMEDKSGPIGASLALENLLLMAHALGLGASGMTGPLVASARIRQILDFAPPWGVLAFVPVGYPAEDPQPTDRRPVARVLRWIS